jgi:NHLM bacteriocin system ABC transporter ATP-binding protein
MNTVIEQILELEGETYTPEVNRPWAAGPAGTAWIVLEGSLDLFLIRRDANGEATSSRYPLLRIEAGEAAFAIASPLPGMSIELSACPRTSLRRASLDDVLIHEQAYLLAERWLLALGRSMLPFPAPKSAAGLHRGAEFCWNEKQNAVVPLDATVWLQLEAGTAHLQGRSGSPAIEVNRLLPVPKTMWLGLDEGTHLMALRDLPEPESRRQGFEHLHEIIASLWVDDWRTTQTNDFDQAMQRRANDQTISENALIRLASPVHRTADAGGDESSISDPVYLACVAAGKAQGIEIRPHPDLLRGAKLKNAVPDIARASGIRARRVALKDEWWNGDFGPLVAFVDQDNRPVALLPQKRSGYKMYDPALKSSVPLTKERALELNALAFVFYPSLPTKPVSLGQLLWFGLRTCGKEIRLIALMGLLSGLLALALPVSTGVVFDRIIPGSQRSQLIYMSAFLLVSALATALFELGRGYLLLRVEGKLDSVLQAALWDRLLNLPVPFFRRYGSGDLAARSLGISQIRQILTGSTISSILSGIFSVFSLALMFYYSVKLAWIGFGAVVLFAVVAGVNGYLQVTLQRTISLRKGQLASTVLQYLSGIAKFRTSGTENRAFANWAKDFAAQKTIAVKMRGVDIYFSVFRAVYPVLCSASIFAAYAYFSSLEGAEPMSTGSILAFNAAFVQFLNAALRVTGAAVSAVNVVPLYERAAPILREIPEVDAARSHPGELRGRIEVSHVAFRYRPDAPLILEDVNITVEPGQFAAIVGASGCGKSTLFRMLLGFDQPESGAVYYDGQDLAGLDVQALRQQLGVVIQGSRLLSGDIFTNIIGASPLTLDDAWEAARLSGLDRDIKNMPMGMHTMVSEGGGTLSGGQRQRLLIARSLVNRPRVILFDEATSALDNQTQAIVSQSLERMQATRIVIAHRLSTIVNADKIFVLNKGRVVQSGTYRELIEQEGLFRDLAQRQLA